MVKEAEAEIFWMRAAMNERTTGEPSSADDVFGAARTGAGDADSLAESMRKMRPGFVQN
jgi:hypothetical protein